MATRLVDRPPLDEIAKRSAEAGAGLAAGAKAVGLANHRELLRDHAKRVRDDHEWAKQLRGQETTPAQQGDDMGDIIVTGDLYGDAAVRALEKRSTAEPPAEPSFRGAKGDYRWLLPLVIAGALGTGTAVPLAIEALRPDAPPPVESPEYELPKYDVERWVPGEVP